MGFNEPVISVVIPTYQRPQLLRRAIESVRNQSLKDFQLIVIDDGNDDQVLDLVEGYGDSRIMLIQHQACKGVSAARNTGIDAVISDLVCFLDDDDEFEQGYLATVFDVMVRSKQAGFAWCDIIKAYENEKGEVIKEKVCQINDDPGQSLSFVLRIGTGCGLCCRKSVLDVVGGFDTAFKLSEDRDLLLRMLTKGYGYAHVNHVMYKRYYHFKGSLTDNATAEVNVKYDLALLERHGDFLEQHKFLKVKLIDVIAQYFFVMRDMGNAYAYSLDAWRLLPFRLKGIRRLLRYMLMRKIKS